MKKAWIVIIYLFSVASFTLADDVRISGIYSNLYYHEEAGDLIGEEIMIIPSKEGYSALVQIAEGGAPYAALVPVSIKGLKIEFTLPRDGMYSGAKFIGSFQEGFIVGQFSNGMYGKKVKLKKGKSYWQ